MAIALVILAGGKATRMGGGDKPLIPLAGRPILDHILARLPQIGHPIALNVNGESSAFDAYSLPVLADSLPDHPGPLAGVLAGLDWAAGLPGITDLITLPGDCPFPPRDLMEKLVEGREKGGTPLACATSGGRSHPVIALWPVEARETIRSALQAGERKVGRLIEEIGCTRVEWPTMPFDPFLNINTPEDVASAEQLIARF